MPFQFKSEEVHCIMKACENHTFSGPKPACLAEKYGVKIDFRPFIKVESLSAKEFRDLVRYLKSVAMAGIHNGTVGCGLAYRQYLMSSYNAMRALDICNTVKMASLPSR